MKNVFILFSIFSLLSISACSDNDSDAKKTSSPAVKDNAFTNMVHSQQKAMEKAKEVNDIMKNRNKELDKQLNP